jgi:hypothetical protein
VRTVIVPPFVGVSEIRLDRAGKISVAFTDGRRATAVLGREEFDQGSAIASSTYFPQRSKLHLRTMQGDDIKVDLPRLSDLASVQDRPTIYLDQNHWSTLTKAIYEPGRVAGERERAAAEMIIELATARRIILPMSSAHMAETCKQVDPEQRYRRALTIAQLSAGWQLRDPLELRQLELQQALTIRFRHRHPTSPAAITLESNAIRSGRKEIVHRVYHDLPIEVEWAIDAVANIGAILEVMLGPEHVPTVPVDGWAAGFRRFGIFLRDHPTGKEIKRKRTHATFMTDPGLELVEACHRAGISPDEMLSWGVHHSEEDLSFMPALRLFREVVHEKLSAGELRWKSNDLIDMMYLTAAAGYCDHVVGERAHTSHIACGLRRLGRDASLHRNLRSLVERLRTEQRITLPSEDARADEGADLRF